ncbi:MAG: lysine N(6)-hydroxylase/L-ornithine N(5)-oxygenase family protein [Ferruginibacter sp.]|nr:lysine N(6)-hydroxylase/L-ornithine N(5)-oxygenase family protein [Ferruginibacter sp.]
MDTKKVYDIVGIGIGPFNLGLAALADGIENLQCAFVDKEPDFNWHPGMMIPGAHLQVPFYADLVTLADPMSKYSFLNYLKHKKRLFRFAIHENNFISRKEYNDYCRWVCGQLPSLHFGYCCEMVHFNTITQLYEVIVKDMKTGSFDLLLGKFIVIGVGTVPAVPECAATVKHPMVFHSADYLKKREALLNKQSVCIVGSGQSAAEIFFDLLNDSAMDREVKWFTRSDRFFPMEYSKLSLEMTSPDYIDHFFGLSEKQKTLTLRKQDMLYKGINFSLINAIYDRLYDLQFETAGYKPGLFSNCELHRLKQDDDKLTSGFCIRNWRKVLRSALMLLYLQRVTGIIFLLWWNLQRVS